MIHTDADHTGLPEASDHSGGLGGRELRGCLILAVFTVDLRFNLGLEFWRFAKLADFEFWRS